MHTLSSACLILIALCLAACDDAESKSDPDLGLPDALAGDAAPVDAEPDAEPDAALSGCSAADPAACAYTPEVQDQPGMQRVVELDYVAVTGATRTFSIEVRTPQNPSADTPIVVWSHGGSGGRVDPTPVGRAWSLAFVRAGYVAVAIAHPGHDAAGYTALCEALELDFCGPEACNNNGDCSADVAGETVPGSCDEGICRYFKPGSWDRPNDVRVVLDWIEEEAANGVLMGRVDPSRIVYAGHSAGAGSTNMVAGATRRFQPGDADRLLIDPRPLGFISCSPQGPAEDGFTEESFDRATCEGVADPADQGACLTRPHLTLTGVDDGGRGPVRRQSFDLAPLGDRYLGYITEVEAQHTTFNHETVGCERQGGTPERCAEYTAWIESAALAFLDATLRDSATARAWLESDDLATWAGAALSWERK